MASPTTTTRDDVSAWRLQAFLLAREQGTLPGVERDVRASADEFPWYPCHRAALALLLLDLGREAEARTVFADLAQDEFAALYRDNEWLLGMALASEACALLGEADHAAVLYAQLLPFSGSHAIGHAEGSVGATDRYLGLLAATLGDLGAAIAHLEAAMQLNDQMGSPPWTAHTRVDLARALRARGGPGDTKRADRLERAALATAQALGMLALQIRIRGSTWSHLRRRPTSRRRADSDAKGTTGRSFMTARPSGSAMPRACATSPACWLIRGASSMPWTLPVTASPVRRWVSRTSREWQSGMSVTRAFAWTPRRSLPTRPASKSCGRGCAGRGVERHRARRASAAGDCLPDQ